MPRALDVDRPLLPWSHSGVETFYGRRREQIELKLARLSCQLWRLAGAKPPEPSPSGHAWLSAGRGLHTLGGACALSLVPLAIALVVFAMQSEPEAAIVLLLGIVMVAVSALLVFPGEQMIDRGRRLLVRVPLDLAPPAISARAPRTGTLLLWFGRVLGLGAPVAVAAAGVKLAIGDASAPIRLPFLTSAPALLVVAAAVLSVGSVLLVAGTVVYRRGQATLQPSADEMVASDQRRPVLLLRSFGDEGLNVVEEQTYGQNQALARMEESIAEQFRPFGPLIAIGKPGEALPELGASRNYYSDSDWRPAAYRMMQDALLIVVIAGTTSGLRWEIETISRAGLQSKLLILIPEPQRQCRWDVLIDELRDVDGLGGLPPTAPDGVTCIHPGPDGRATLLVAAQSWKSDYDTAITYALYGLLCATPAIPADAQTIGNQSTSAPETERH